MPFYCKKGDSITAFSSGRETFVNDQLRFYDVNGNQVEYWTLTSASNNCRNFVYESATDAYFVGIATVVVSAPYNYTVVNNSSTYKTDGGVITVDASGNGDYSSLTEALYDNACEYSSPIFKSFCTMQFNR